MAEKITVTFLGTGSSIPTARRNHPSTLVQYRDEMVLFDCGEGTQRQFRKAKLNMMKLTGILISHWHGDHILGLPGILQTLNMAGYDKELQLYGPRGTKKKVQEYVRLFLGKGSKLRIRVHEVSEGVFVDKEEFKIESMPMDHGAPTNAYSFIVKEKKRLDRKKLAKMKLPNGPHMAELTKGKTITINGKKVEGKKLLYSEPERKITVIIDSRYCENAITLAKNADLLVCEASFAAGDEEIAKSHGHMTSTQAATIAKKTKVKSLALNHLSQRYDMIPKKIRAEAREIYKETYVPEDLDKVEL